MGAEFLTQLTHLQSTRFPQIKLVALTRSNKSINTTPSDPSIPIAQAGSLLASSTNPGLSPDQVLQVLLYHNSPRRSVVIDNTSNEDVARSYPSFLKAGISVVTPNKKAFSGDLSLWQDIQSSSANSTSSPPSKTGGYIFHEATVGAGLPILTTLKDLVLTGDQIHKIEGVFSGTMSYLFNTFAPYPPRKDSPKWSATVKVAAEQGYTEPDPRDDLNGADVARKLTILARICSTDKFPPVKGIDSFPVQSLIPKSLESSPTPQDFLSKLPEFDKDMDKIKNDAEAQGKVVRFVGKIDVIKGEVKVGLESFEPGHPIAGLTGADNLVAFHTERYSSSPLVVQGGGAGGAVTAMGVAADFIRVLQRIG